MRRQTTTLRWENSASEAPTSEAPASEASRDLLSYEVPQLYSEYTPSAHAVWNEVVERNDWVVSRNRDRIHPGYIEGLRALDLPRHVPRVEEINERLKPTGWKTVCVDGYIPTSVYVRLMAGSVFPIARAIRKPEHIDYAPMPDMVHDILGHLPMLFLREHRDYLRRLAGVMARAVPNQLDAELFFANRHMSELKTDLDSSAASIRDAELEVKRVQRLLEANASELTKLGRLYLWTVEFGLIGTPDACQAYGAALLSSPTELAAVGAGTTQVRLHGPEALAADISFSDLQAQYFAARDFAHLDQVLTDYEDTMEFRASFPRTSEIRAIKPAGGRKHHA